MQYIELGRSLQNKHKEASSFEFTETINKLSRIAKRLNNIATEQCNGIRDPKREELLDVEWDNLITKARTLGQVYQIAIEAQGDPRGFCLKAKTSDGFDFSSLLFRGK